MRDLMRHLGGSSDCARDFEPPETPGESSAGDSLYRAVRARYGIGTSAPSDRLHTHVERDPSPASALPSAGAVSSNSMDAKAHATVDVDVDKANVERTVRRPNESTSSNSDHGPVADGANSGAWWSRRSRGTRSAAFDVKRTEKAVCSEPSWQSDSANLDGAIFDDGIDSATDSPSMPVLRDRGLANHRARVSTARESRRARFLLKWQTRGF